MFALNLAVPAFPGVGAAVDISGIGSILTMLFFGTQDDNIVVEQSFDDDLAPGAKTYQPLVSFSGGPASVIVEADGSSLRARRIGGSGGAYNIHFAPNQAGISGSSAIALTTNAPATTAAVDISGQPPNLSLVLEDGSGNTVGVEQSFDNVLFAPLGQLIANVPAQVAAGANWLRVQVRTALGAGARVKINGIPKP